MWKMPLFAILIEKSIFKERVRVMAFNTTFQQYFSCMHHGSQVLLVAAIRAPGENHQPGEPAASYI